MPLFVVSSIIPILDLHLNLKTGVYNFTFVLFMTCPLYILPPNHDLWLLPEVILETALQFSRANSNLWTGHNKLTALVQI